jgi:FdhD protein
MKRSLHDYSGRDRIPGITGVILAGGESWRMQSVKSLLPLHGARFIDHVYRVMADLFDEVLIVTNSPEGYADIVCRKVPDIHVNRGVLAGIHAGLCHARHDKAFVVACDMPFINPHVVRAVCGGTVQADVMIPAHEKGLESLHVLYGKNCIGAIVCQLDAGQKRIASFFPQVHVREIGNEHWQEVDPEGRSFRNINTPEEYFLLRGESDAHQPAPGGEVRQA